MSDDARDEDDVLDDMEIDLASERLRMMQTHEVLAIGRLTHHHPNVDADGEVYERDKVVKPEAVGVEAGANVVSSLLTNGKHAPAIDVDVKARLVPSSTPGHSHAYIDHEMPWDDYLLLLRVLTQVGIVQKGFYDSAVRRGTTLLRLPHVRKRVVGS